ncbi:MAG: hypothetical protein NZ550_05285 [Fimbriimonadales bacterium]|nr:hypothetical protein [Fimbriimonadales bacterium]MDW8051137.1 hypothetical protein [Armatimonadota bacterium]
MRRYRVSAKPHPQFRGYRKGGIWFPNAPDYVELDENALTDAIRNCPLLLIEEVSDAETHDPTMGMADAQADATAVVEGASTMPQRGATRRARTAPKRARSHRRASRDNATPTRAASIGTLESLTEAR